MQREKLQQYHIKCLVLFAAVFGVMFLLSLWTPLIADDYNYAFGYASDSRISSLRDIWESMKWHRKLLNPRVIAHGCLSMVLMYPRWVFAALNGAAAVFFSWTTADFLNGQGSLHPVRGTACMWMLIWICMPGFGQVFFWTAGACNYFWGVVLSWFVIRCVLRLEQQPEVSGLRICLLILPAFAAGAWSEHISFAMLMILFLLFIWRWKQTGRFPVPEAIILLAGCAGYLYLMLAPSAKIFQRLHDAGDPTETGNLTRILSTVPRGVLPTLLVGFILLAVLILLLRKRYGTRRVFFLLSSAAAVLSGAVSLAAGFHALRTEGICALISSSPVGFCLAMTLYCTELSLALKRQEAGSKIFFSLVMVFSGLSGFSLFLFGEYFPIRGFCAPVTLLVLAAVLLSDHCRCRGENSEKTGIRAFALLTLCFVLCFALGAEDIFRVHRAATAREEEFIRAAAGDKIVRATPYPFRTKYTAQYGNPDLSPDADWPNGVIADYYDVVRIIVE